MIIKKPIFVNISLSIFSIIFSFLICEIIVRALKIAPGLARIETEGKDAKFKLNTDDPRIIYEPIPNVGDINSDGFRDILHKIEKPIKTHRIAVLGDSIAYGYCTEGENIKINDVFSSKLSEKLNKSAVSKKKIEVLNMSVSGYSTQQELALFNKKGLAYGPDTVLVAYCMNDDETLNQSNLIRKLNTEKGFVETFNLLSEMKNNFFLRSELFRFIWVALYSPELQKAPAYAIDALSYQDRVGAGFSELKDLSMRNNFKVIIVIFPHLHFQNNEGYSILPQHEMVEKIAHSNGFLVVDLLSYFLQKSDNKLNTLAGRCSAMHLDEKGHEFSAEVVTEFLLTNSSYFNF